MRAQRLLLLLVIPSALPEACLLVIARRKSLLVSAPGTEVADSFDGVAVVAVLSSEGDNKW